MRPQFLLTFKAELLILRSIYKLFSTDGPYSPHAREPDLYLEVGSGLRLLN